MALATNDATNVIIKDVELHWVKLDKPVDPFGTLQYEIQIQAPKKREKELAAFGKVKVIEGNKVSINLKKKALKADGTDAAKVRVVDASKNSIGNVMVMQKPYEIKAPNGKVTKSGISNMLTAVQVTTLIKYVPKNDNFVDFEASESDVDVTTEDSPF
jgi:hypothetical protein